MIAMDVFESLENKLRSHFDFEFAPCLFAPFCDNVKNHFYSTKAKSWVVVWVAVELECVFVACEGHQFET